MKKNDPRVCCRDHCQFGRVVNVCAVDDPNVCAKFYVEDLLPYVATNKLQMLQGSFERRKH